MSRGFLLLTLLLSALTFAGVWRLTAPAPVAAPLAAVAALPAPPPARFVTEDAPPPRTRAARIVHAAARAPRRPARVAAPVPRADDVYYAGCNEVRALGLAPLRRTDPGYREGMDGDGDGLACEPHY